MVMRSNLEAGFLEKFLSLIYRKSPLQKKAITKFLAAQDAEFWARAERFAEKMLEVLGAQQMSLEYVVDAYLKLCRNMLAEQIKFRKTGKYSCARAGDAYASMYSSETEMASYMYGLALSTFLWPNHYKIFDFFIRESRGLSRVRSCLEVGPGHGLFLAESLSIFSNATFVAIDISPVATRIAQAVVTHFTGRADCRFELKDVVRDFDVGRFDYVVMGEVLEHLDNPKTLLRKVRDVLNEDGRMFVTTCANAPAVDHVYLYESVGHIRRELHETGFEIVAELALGVGAARESEWDAAKVEVNYAAMLKTA